MIQKILSTGHPGVGQGAICAALSLDLPHGGTLPPPHGGIAKEKAKCVEANVRHSDGTLILLFSGEPAEEATSARKAAERRGCPHLSLQMEKTSTFEASLEIHDWLKSHDIHILHVAGSPGEAGNQEEKITQGLLEAVYYLGLIEANTAGAPTPDHGVPASVEDFVLKLSTEMPLKERVLLSHMAEEKIGALCATLGRHIEVRLEQWRKLSPLPAFLDADGKEVVEEDLPLFIIQALWRSLRESHRLRLVK